MINGSICVQTHGAVVYGQHSARARTHTLKITFVYLDNFRILFLLAPYTNTWEIQSPLSASRKRRRDPDLLSPIAKNSNEKRQRCRRSCTWGIYPTASKKRIFANFSVRSVRSTKLPCSRDTDSWWVQIAWSFISKKYHRATFSKVKSSIVYKLPRNRIRIRSINSQSYCFSLHCYLEYVGDGVGRYVLILVYWWCT